jgi:hypothetical protein
MRVAGDVSIRQAMGLEQATESLNQTAALSSRLLPRRANATNVASATEIAMKNRALLAALVFLLAPLAPTAAATRTFFTGMAGSTPPDPADRAMTYFRMPPVRALLERLEKGPLAKTEVAASLAGSGATVDRLMRTHILRRVPAGYAIGFSYFTLDDMRRIHATAERFVPELVRDYEAHADEFGAIFRRYPVRSVDRKMLATVVLAGFALNWDGLRQTAAEGYRRPELVTGPGWKYSFFAAEDDPAYFEHGFIWGSSSVLGPKLNLPERPVDFTFSSFGDPYSDPRMNLPDVFFMTPKELTADVRAAVAAAGTRTETFDGSSFPDALGISRARSLGPMLFALRSGPLSAAALAGFVEPEDRAHAAALIDLLVAMDYVRQRADGRYELIRPVLDRADKTMLDEALALHRRILKAWLARVYPQVRSELQSITAVRQGVPFEATFTQIWHEYFGLATRMLVERGMIADPYSPLLRHRGSVPTVWRYAIYDFDPG